MRLINKDITFIDYPDPNDWASIFYFSGCCNNCINCQNKELQNPEVGKTIIDNVDDLYNIVKETTIKHKSNKVVFSGGDPLFTTNIDLIREFLNKHGSEFDICIYTGHSIDYVKENNISGFKFIKCGKYIPELSKDRNPGMTDTEFILASSNQDFYDSNYKKLSNNGVLNFKDIIIC